MKSGASAVRSGSSVDQLRFGRQAEEIWNHPAQRAECDHLLSRVVDILEACIQGVAGGQTEISKRFEE